MFRNLFKKGLVLTLTASLLFGPSSTTFAAEQPFSVPPITTQTPFHVTPFEIPSNYSPQSLKKYETQGNDVKTLDDVQALADSKAKILTSIYGATSVQFALIDNGVLSISGQAGTFNKDITGAPTANSMYGIASVSKVFTASSIMNLVEDGKIELDKPVTTYIPEFTMADPRYKDITVRMLINHSSGLMGSTQGNALLFGDSDMSTTQNLLKSLKKQRLKANPGEFSVYCNDGFTLAELVVEHVTGMSFSNYIKETFTSKLGMENTNTPVDTFDREKLAKIYYPGIEKYLPVDNFNAIGTGGLYSSATDLCKFSNLFMSNSSSGILNSSSVIAMENKEYLRGVWPEDIDSTVGYGLGWDCVNTYPFNQYGIKALSKGGDSLRYHANLTVLPEQNMAIAVLSSGSSSALNQIMAQEIMLAALKAKGTITEIKPDKTVTIPTKTPVPSELKEYSGYYNTNGAMFKVSITDSGDLELYVVGSDTPAYTYTHGGDGKFYYTERGTTECLSFVKESNGVTYISSTSYNSAAGLGQTAATIYFAQKIESNPISKKVKETWQNRSKKSYFLVNEKYSSQLYIQGLLYTSFPLSKELEGYVSNATIIDANHAETRLRIPCANGRDLMDYTFYKKGDIEYLQMSNRVFASEDAIKPLSSKSKYTYKIGKDGYAKYYRVTAGSAGKVMSVKVPKNAAFMVYQKDGTYINNSYISGKKKITLPKNGYVVFVGKANAEFAVTCK